jgi:hypothetical protein
MKFKPMFGEYQFLYILIVIDIGPFEQFHKNLILVLNLSKNFHINLVFVLDF